MLDLVFLVLLIYVCFKAERGEYKETACNVALVIGILAGVVGAAVGIARGQGTFVFLNIIVMLMAFGLRFAARHLVKLYIDKQVAETERLEREQYLRSRGDEHTVYGDDTDFDDEELRFGKGGYTDPKL